MSKRAARVPAPAAVTQGQSLLFDVERPEPAVPALVVRCSECNHVLRSDRSKAAGVSQACAAKVGRAVLATVRGARKTAAAA
ncbi:DUF6011 domain-containing protein [Streptomyces sp. NBC_00425]|uniref:DUF6011 domain-containing protein n=1 Tax=Streptomyces sp. NBC_00425 TaxID=2975740 RepID=UPI002E1F8CF4